MVGAAGRGGELVHRRLHDRGQRVVKTIHGFASLEIHIGVLRGAAERRLVRRHGPCAERRDVLLVDDRAQIVVRQQREFGNFVRGAKAVEEMDERHPRAIAGGMRNQREVVRFLARVAAQQGAARGAARHDILVVAENRQPLRGQRTRAHVHGKRQQFPRDLVEIRDHQQQSLRRRERRGQRPALQGPVERPGRPGLALHLHHGGNGPPHVGPPLARPFRRPVPPSSTTA